MFNQDQDQEEPSTSSFAFALAGTKGAPHMHPVPSFPPGYRQEKLVENEWTRGVVNTRKRKLAYDPYDTGYNAGTGDAPIRARLDPDLAQMTPLYQAISEFNLVVMLPVLEVMPSEDLRRIAAVNSEWCYYAYREIRSRYGNSPFPMLLMLEYENRNYISLRNHFHHALVRPNEKISEGDFMKNEMIASSQAYFNAVEKGLCRKSKCLGDVELILAFGSDEQMCEELVDIGSDIPRVPVFLLVVGPSSVAFYTTPDFKNVGDSRNGMKASLFKKDYSLGSICIPRSPHLEVQGTNLTRFNYSKRKAFFGNASYSNACLRLNSLLTRPMKAKLVMLFKYFEDCEATLRFQEEEIARAFLHDGADSITIISVECAMAALGGTKVGPVGSHNPRLGSALTFKGDEHFSHKVIELWEAKGCVKKFSFQNAFHQLQEFILPKEQTPYCQFAILLSCNVILNDGSVEISGARRMLEKFHQTFPHVPVAGMGTDRPLSHETITCIQRKPLAYSSTLDNSKPSTDEPSQLSMILVVFKYPAKSQTSDCSNPGNLAEKVEEMDIL